MRIKLFQVKKSYAVQKRKKVRIIRRAAGHPAVAIPLLTISILMFLSVVAILAFSGGRPQLRSTDTHVVIINHDNAEQSLPTREKTVGDILERAEIEINEGDVVEPALETEVVSDNFRINVYRGVPVTIVDRDRKISVHSAAKTPRSIVKQAGIEVYPEDRLEMSPAENFLVEGSIGQRLVIKRATAVALNLYGTQLSLRTQAETVGELLEEKNIQLAEGDTVQPGLGTPLKSGDQVFVLREGIKIEFAEEEIPMPEQIVEDHNLSFGTQVLRQQGSAGKRLVTYQVDENTGERKKIQEIDIVEAVPQIIARGQAVQIPDDKRSVMAAAGIAPSDYPYVDFIISHESGWCPTKLQGQIGYCPPYAPETIPSNLGYGLGQATPGTKMSLYGSDWKTNAVTQLEWAISYVNGRYGSWEEAYNFWQTNRWW
jgi:uncharacterized protein YabE (DUF348 family)